MAQFFDQDTESESSSSDIETGPYFKNSKTDITRDYTIRDRLGDGAFSVVYSAKRNTDSLDAAIKVIKKRKVGQEDLKREVEIWTRASAACTRVVQLYEIYEDINRVYLVMELVVGGELFEKISKMNDYSEPYAAKIMKQLFYIIVQLHRVDIIHQDLKPENLLLMGEDSTLLKLCDFGLAEIADDDIELFGCVGSTTYMAPEVVNETGHHKPVDVYAAGVIMYIMLCGYPPFEPENGIIELEFPEREWQDITPHAKDLITALLEKDPERRPTAEQALKHIWFQDVETIRNPKTLARAVNMLSRFQELGPNGSTKDLRIGRTSVIGIFENPSSENPSQNSKSAYPEKMDIKVQPGFKIQLPDLPSIPPHVIDKRKSGAKTDRTDKDKNKKPLGEKKNLPVTAEKEKDSKKQQDPDKKKKKQENRKKRASTSIVSLVQQSGLVDFDPKGIFNKKKNETDTENIALRTTEKKKENRKSIRNNHKSDKKKSVKEYSLLLDDQALQAAGPRLEEIISSFHKELTYQNDLLDYMREESILLRRKIQEETEKCSQIMEQFESEITSLRKTTEDERRERRHLQSQLESLQNLSPLPSPSSASVTTPPTKNHSKPQTSKPKRTQKKKVNL